MSMVCIWQMNKLIEMCDTHTANDIPFTPRTKLKVERWKFSTVRLLPNLLHKMTKELTFENMYQPNVPCVVL